MRGYSLFKQTFVMLYETIKLVMLVILLVSLLSILYKAYIIYTLGEKAQKFLVLKNQIKNSLFFDMYSFSIPFWKDSIYLILYKINLLDLAATFGDNCIIIEKNSFKPCRVNINYCKTCICLIESVNPKKLLNDLKIRFSFTSPITYKQLNLFLDSIYDWEYTLVLGYDNINYYFSIIPNNIFVQDIYGNVEINSYKFIDYLDFLYNVFLPYVSSKIKSILIEDFNLVKKIYCYSIDNTIFLLNDNFNKQHGVKYYYIYYPAIFSLYAIKDVYYLGNRLTYLTLDTYKLSKGNYNLLAISREFIIK